MVKHFQPAKETIISLEEDHIIATTLGGNNVYENLQLLHGHCHDAKIALDLIDIRSKQSSAK